jgi:hypothetical protein
LPIVETTHPLTRAPADTLIRSGITTASASNHKRCRRVARAIV